MFNIFKRQTMNKNTFLEFLNAKNMYSWCPDKIQLEKQSYQPLFVCCNLAKGGNEHYYIDGNYLENVDGLSHNCTVFTKDRFELWRHLDSPNIYPVPLQTGSPRMNNLSPETTQVHLVGSAKLKGKLYKINSSIMFYLDNLRHNGVVFHRRKIDIDLPFRFLGGQTLGQNRLSDEFIEDGKAWFYVGDTDLWQSWIYRHIGYFSPARLISPGNIRTKGQLAYKKYNPEPYYTFNTKDPYNSE